MIAFYDTLFRQKRKGDKWKVVDAPSPALEGPVADTHCHLHMTTEPAFELARCSLNGVDAVCCITDPTEDGLVVFEQLDSWMAECQEHMVALGHPKATPPATRISVGCHPHNAKLFDAAAEQQLYDLLKDPRVNAVGEIGLDYHYDLSPREDQRRVFRRQVQLAHDLGLPVALHIREAHDEAFAIMEEEGWPEAGTLLHCCTVGPEELAPWVEAGCYVAFGGAMTFNNGDAIREAMKLVPEDRLLTETDTPYMAPVPLRGSDCRPDFVLFTAARMAEVRDVAPGPDRARLLASCRSNAARLLCL